MHKKYRLVTLLITAMVAIWPRTGAGANPDQLQGPVLL